MKIVPLWSLARYLLPSGFSGSDKRRGYWGTSQNAALIDVGTSVAALGIGLGWFALR